MSGKRPYCNMPSCPHQARVKGGTCKKHAGQWQIQERASALVGEETATRDPAAFKVILDYLRADGPADVSFESVAVEIAALVEKKQAAYGDSFGRAGGIVDILYPNGIPPSKLRSSLTLIRVIDKLFRVATDEDALGEDPWMDILGYALLEVVAKRKRKAAVLETA